MNIFKYLHGLLVYVNMYGLLVYVNMYGLTKQQCKGNKQMHG